MNSHPVIIAPSILSADFARIGDEIEKVRVSGADWIHLDVMDGVFVPNLTFGPKMIADIRRVTDLPLDTHLMITDPQDWIERYAEAGSDYITFHYEATVHVHRVVQQIQSAGKKAGVSIVPSTPVFLLQDLLPELDLILVMGVNPGFGGQALIPSCLEKIRYLDTMRTEHRYRYRISVDGGMNSRTAGTARIAGADVIVSGSAFFAAREPEREVRILRGTESL